MGKEVTLPPPFVLTYRHWGMNILPIRRGTKRPSVERWEQWKARPQTDDEIATLVWNGGIAAINGIGQWAAIDVDEAKTAAVYRDILVALGLSPLEAADHPYVVRTGDGFHIWLQVAGRSDETILFYYPQVEDDRFKQIELRLAGHYTILPPTIHPEKNRQYEWARGFPDCAPLALPLATVTDALGSLFRPGTKDGVTKTRGFPKIETPKTPPSVGVSSYAHKALTSEGDNVRSAATGNRNNQLNVSAFRLGQLVAAGKLARDQVVDALTNAARSVHLTEQEIAATIRSGLESGIANPRVLALPENIRRSVVEIIARLEYTDAGNAEAVYLLHGARFLYCAVYGIMWYNGQCWQQDKDKVAITEATLDALRLRRKIAVDKDIDDSKLLTAVRTGKKNIDAAIDLLCRGRAVNVDVSDFDSDPDLLNVANGVLNLKTDQLVPHEQSQRFTYCIPYKYDPGADTRGWRAFLRDVVECDLDPADQERAINYLLMCLGYSLTGHVSEEKMFDLYGPPRAGKGTLAEAMQKLLPDPLSRGVDFSTFTQKREPDAQNFDLAPLKPCRVVFASEAKRHTHLDAAKIKSLTGGDTVACAFKHRDIFNYKPVYKIWLLSNWKVAVDVDDDAAWGRVQVFNFPLSRLGHEDKTLKARLSTPDQLQGLLVLVVDGARRWYAASDGLQPPAQVMANVQSARDEIDYVGQWLDECCICAPGKWASHTALYQSYQQWCKENGETARGSKGFSQALERKGYARAIVKREGKAIRCFADLAIADGETASEPIGATAAAAS